MFELHCGSYQIHLSLATWSCLGFSAGNLFTIWKTLNSVQQVWTLASRVDGFNCFQSTFSVSDAADFTVIVALSGAELKHVDRHSGPDLLLSQAHAVVEDFEELLRLLLLVQLAVEGNLKKRLKQILA